MDIKQKECDVSVLAIVVAAWKEMKNTSECYSIWVAKYIDVKTFWYPFLNLVKG